MCSCRVAISVFCLVFAVSVASTGCAPKASPEKASVVRFPELPSLEAKLYGEIKKACAAHWQLDKMKLETFTVRADMDEYLVECDELNNKELWHCVIRVNSKGEWINDGRTQKP